MYTHVKRASLCNIVLYILSHLHLFFKVRELLAFILLFACAALFMSLDMTVLIPCRTPAPADFVLLEDELSKQKPVAQ